MNCIVNAGELLGAIRSVQARAKHNGALEVLKHIKLEVAAGRLTLLGNDMDSCSTDAVEIEDGESGAWCMPADPLARLVAGLPKSSAVTIATEGTSAIIKSGRSRYKLPILAADVFPDALVPDGGIRVTLSADDVKQLFERPAAALNPKDERLIASGAWLHEDGGMLVSAAYATYNLMRFATNIPAQGFAGVMVAKSTMDELVKFGPGVATISDKLISIENGVRRYCSKLIEASFPESYRKIIPPADGAHISVDRDWFMECLSRLLAVGDFSGVDLIDLSVGAKELTISTIGLADGAETIECDVDGAERKFFCIKTSQLLNGCKALKGDALHVYMRGEMDPVLLFDPAEASAINVQMPCLSKNRKAEAA